MFRSNICNTVTVGTSLCKQIYMGKKYQKIKVYKISRLLFGI